MFMHLVMDSTILKTLIVYNRLMLIYNKLSRINGHWNLSKILSHENDQKFKSNQQRVEVNIRYVHCVQSTTTQITYYYVINLKWPFGMPSREVFVLYVLLDFIIFANYSLLLRRKNIKGEHRIRSNYTIKNHMLLGHMHIACGVSPFRDSNFSELKKHSLSIYISKSKMVYTKKVWQSRNLDCKLCSSDFWFIIDCI